jgi:hypothetical protein
VQYRYMSCRLAAQERNTITGFENRLEQHMLKNGGGYISSPFLIVMSAIVVPAPKPVFSIITGPAESAISCF